MNETEQIQGTVQIRSGNKFKRWYQTLNLKQRMLLVLLPVACIPILTISIIGLISVNNATERSLMASMETVVQMASARVSLRLDIYRELSAEIAQWIGTLEEGSVGVDMLANVRERNGLVNVCLIDMQGRCIHGRDHSKDMFYTVVKDKQEVFVTDVEHSPYYDQRVFTVSAPVFRQGKLSKVLALTVDAELLNESVDQIRVGQNGNSFIMNADAVCIAHTDETMVGIGITDLDAMIAENKLYAPLKKVWEDMAAGRSGSGQYDYVTGHRLVAYAPVANAHGWSVAVSAATSDFDGNVKRVSTINTLAALISVLLVGTIIVIFATVISRRIRVVTERLEGLSKGDLTSVLHVAVNHDEIGRLTNATGVLMQELSSIITDVKVVLSEIAQGNLCVASTKEYIGDFSAIKTAMEQNIESTNYLIARIARSADEVARASSQMAVGAEGLSQGASEQASSVEELFTTIAEIAHRASDIAGSDIILEETGDLTQEERIHAREAAAKTSMDKLMIAMERVLLTSQQIKKITYSLENISSETKILALNASVEAAHAGEAGKGFGVIASEVRQLAAKSKDAVVTANQQTERIFTAINRGNAVVSETMEGVSSIVVALEQVKSALSQISNVIENTAATAEQTAASSEELSAQASMLKDIISQFHHKELF